jgi:hypothetical protein
MSGLVTQCISFFAPKNLALVVSGFALVLLLLGTFAPVLTHAQGSLDLQNYGAGQRDRTAEGAAAVGDGVNANGTEETEEPAPNNTGENDLVYAILALIAWGILKFLAFMMGIAGVLLNFAVNVFILDFGKYFAATSGVLLAWGILRDLANIILVFGFVYIGISSILGLATYTIEKTLPKLLIFAVLLNFSFFITATVIDATNAVSASLYSQAIPANSRCADVANSNIETILATGCADTVGISGSVLQASGLQSIFAFDNDVRSGIDEELTSLEELILYLLLSLFLIVSTFVFASTAIMLLTRAVVLLLVLILSPIGFIAMAIPFLKKQGESWWKALIDNVLFAPVVLLLILASIKVAQGISGNNSSIIQAILDGINSTNGGITTSIGMIAVFLVVTGLMYAAIVVAKQFSSFGSDIALKQAGKLAFAPSAMLARRTIGAASGAAARQVRKSPIGNTMIGRGLANVVGAGANKSFDLRSSALLGKDMKTLVGGPSEAAKAGIAGILKKEQEDRVKYNAERLGDLGEKHARLSSLKATLTGKLAQEQAAQKPNAQRIKSLNERLGIINKKIEATLPGSEARFEDLDKAMQENAALYNRRKNEEKQYTDSKDRLAAQDKQLEEDDKTAKDRAKALKDEEAKLISDLKVAQDEDIQLRKDLAAAITNKDAVAEERLRFEISQNSSKISRLQQNAATAHQTLEQIEDTRKHYKSQRDALVKENNKLDKEYEESTLKVKEELKLKDAEYQRIKDAGTPMSEAVKVELEEQGREARKLSRDISNKRDAFIKNLEATAGAASLGGRLENPVIPSTATRRAIKELRDAQKGKPGDLKGIEKLLKDAGIKLK